MEGSVPRRGGPDGRHHLIGGPEGQHQLLRQLLHRHRLRRQQQQHQRQHQHHGLDGPDGSDPAGNLSTGQPGAPRSRCLPLGARSLPVRRGGRGEDHATASPIGPPGRVNQ